ncbi:hypothetical protein ROR02_03130 [Pararhodospirillum oryzae]|uniref:Uncharacterized protein n=1 Tax=Pararhodospirillum oryzae TaxID=478448 RepID=A0A512H3Y8_9PROT|nr:hypothetical protein ROR02_03130 [Pararhodospirillum oryzae]
MGKGARTGRGRKAAGPGPARATRRIRPRPRPLCQGRGARREHAEPSDSRKEGETPEKQGRIPAVSVIKHDSRRGAWYVYLGRRGRAPFRDPGPSKATFGGFPINFYQRGLR